MVSLLFTEALVQALTEQFPLLAGAPFLLGLIQTGGNTGALQENMMITITSTVQSSPVQYSTVQYRDWGHTLDSGVLTVLLLLSWMFSL